MGCINLKYRTKKGRKYLFCTTKNCEISFYDCNGCEFKEYRIHNNCKNNVDKNKKCTVKPKTLCKNDFPVKGKTIKRSSKITKLERNRKSVFTTNLTKCIMCGKPKDNLHEIFMGKNRQNSMKYGYVIPVCIICHQKCHKDRQIQEFWHKRGQLYFEKNIGSREEFIIIFGRNYL